MFGQSLAGGKNGAPRIETSCCARPEIDEHASSRLVTTALRPVSHSACQVHVLGWCQAMKRKSQPGVPLAQYIVNFSDVSGLFCSYLHRNRVPDHRIHRVLSPRVEGP